MEKHVLVVDDELAVRELLKFKLVNRGYHVTTAKSADEFLAIAAGSKFDLFILDIWLDRKLGTDLYSRLLELGLDKDMPVIFITALVEDSPSSHVKAGCQYAMYGKPLDMNQLMDDIHLLFESRGAGAVKKE